MTNGGAARKRLRSRRDALAAGGARDVRVDPGRSTCATPRVAGSLREDELRIEAAERSAVELTALRIAGFPPGEAPPRGAFRFALRDARIDVAFVSESARVDLNGAPKAMLAKLFAALGADADEAGAIAGNVVAWRKGAPDGADADAYQAAGRSYAPRHAPFQDVLELSLVLGVTPELMRRALPYLTVNNPSGQIDVRAADPLVLAALPNLDPERASSLLAARGGAKLRRRRCPRRARLGSRLCDCFRPWGDARLRFGRPRRPPARRRADRHAGDAARGSALSHRRLERRMTTRRCDCTLLSHPRRKGAAC